MMKWIVVGVLVLLGAVNWVAFFQTFEKQACVNSCGCCPGSVETETVYDSFWRVKVALLFKSRNSCQLAGCGPEQNAVYLDLGLVGAALVGAGVFVATRRES